MREIALGGVAHRPVAPSSAISRRPQPVRRCGAVPGTVRAVRGERLGVGTGGVWTAAQARALGVTVDQARRARERGEWQALRRGVYLDGGVVPGPDHRAWAAVLSAGGPTAGGPTAGGPTAGGPAGVLAGGRSAARLHGLPLIDDADPATGAGHARHDDVVARTRLRGGDGLHVHTWTVAPADVGTLRGCPSVSLGETLWQLRLVVTHEALVCALDAALHLRRTTVDELGRRAAAGRGSRGSRAFDDALAQADGRSESPLETLTRLLLLPALPELEPQVVVVDRGGREVARIDLGDRRRRLGVEADGRSHRGEVSLAADRRRERRAGWTFERVTWWEVRRQPDQTRSRVVAAATRLDALRGTAPTTPRSRPAA